MSCKLLVTRHGISYDLGGTYGLLLTFVDVHSRHIRITYVVCTNVHNVCTVNCKVNADTFKDYLRYKSFN